MTKEQVFFRKQARSLGQTCLWIALRGTKVKEDTVYRLAAGAAHWYFEAHPEKRESNG